MIAIRKILDCFFSEEELSILDDILPSFTRRKQLDDEDRKVRNSYIQLRIGRGQKGV
jgi:hypothetical protein